MFDHDESHPILPPVPSVVRAAPLPRSVEASDDDSPLLAAVLAEVQRSADQYAACLASTAANNAIVAANPDSPAAQAILKRRAQASASKARARERKRAAREEMNARWRALAF